MEPFLFKLPRHEEETVRVEYWNLPKFYERFHYHEECQLTLILLSSGTIFIGNKLVEYKEGDMFFIGSNVPHFLRHDNLSELQEDSNVRAISVFFSLKTILRILETIPESYHIKNMMSDSAFGYKLESAYVKEINQLVKEIGNTTGFLRILALLKIIDRLAGTHQKKKLILSKLILLDPSQSNKLNKIFDYILSQYNEKITLKDASSQVYMTPNAFSRFFKKHTQKSFSEFLIEVRINKACKMLQNENNNVYDACYGSGYNNISNFHRHFRRVIGLTPNEYKKQFAQSGI